MAAVKDGSSLFDSVNSSDSANSEVRFAFVFESSPSSHVVDAEHAAKAAQAAEEAVLFCGGIGGGIDIGSSIQDVKVRGGNPHPSPTRYP